MRARLADLQRLFDLVVGPRATLRAVIAGAPWGTVLLLLGLLQVTLVLVQSRALVPALLSDPLFADVPQAASRVWWARALAAAGAPFGMALRAAVFALLLQGVVAIAGGTVRWKALWSLALHLELVFVIETAATTVLLGLDPPSSLAELPGTPLRAGLDLFWEPQSTTVAACLGAANIFTIWWAALLGIALAILLGRKRAGPLAALFWLGLAGMRVAFRIA
jgi:hypothetical protein